MEDRQDILRRFSHPVNQFPTAINQLIDEKGERIPGRVMISGEIDGKVRLERTRARISENWETSIRRPDVDVL